ncbi:MAG: type II secretion system F family protein [bacterium]
MDLKQKYNKRIKAELEGKATSAFEDASSSDEYKFFMDETKNRKKSFYETACYYAEKYVGIEPDKKTAEKISKSAKFANLQLTPKGVYSFGIVAPLLFVFIFGMVSFLLFSSPFFLFILILFGGLGAIIPLFQMPNFLADRFRLKASGQMVLSIFYLVTYMRHTSNLERAIEFAAAFLNKPLSTEFRKVLWDVEAGSFDTISDSLENMVDKWREYNPEFVDAIHLIESSLLEGSDNRRLQLLDKSLDVILDETYEKMLHFAHNLQSPITTLHMLGIILPILGLVILPLALSFLEEIKWYHIAVLYNVFLPVMVFLLGQRILSRRPSGYGETPLDESNKEVKAALDTNIILFGKDTNIPPNIFLAVGLILSLFMGLSPVIMHALNIEDFGFGDELALESCGQEYCFLGYREVESSTFGEGLQEVGPYGMGASIMSLLFILGVGITFGIYYNSKSRALKKVFDKSKELENQFSSALFQLGNRLGDNIPAEIAAYKVAQTLPDTAAGNFFKIVSVNIQKLGMSVQDAIFNSSVGAIIYYPSQLIESSMKVLIQAVKKGPLIASNALINISRYVKEMHKVEERLQDLMAEVISSMKSQISFLTPIIAAIVVGITSMISTIIGNLNMSLSAVGENVPANSGQLDMVSQFFKAAMPTYYFQIIVGLYVLQITFILTILVNSIKNGSDKVEEQYMLGQGLTKSISLYALSTIALMIVFNIVTLAIMPAL